MPLLEFSLDSDRFRAVLAEMQKVTHNFTVPMRQAGIYLMKVQDSHFRAQQSPDGSGWEQLALGTLMRRRKKGAGAKILQDTGRLRNSVSPARGDGNIFRIDSNSVEIGTNLKYANVHQFGANIRISAGLGKVHLKMTPSGKLSRQGKNRKLARFARRADKYKKTVFFQQGGRNIKIPARPFLGMNDGNQEHITRIFVEWFGKLCSKIPR